MKTSRRHADAATSITYRRAPECWNDGFPLGNGFLGAMLWGNGKPLSLTLDCADLWDLRIDTEFMNHPDYNYAGLRRMIEAQRFDEAKEVFETREKEANPIAPTKVSIGRAELELGSALDYECRLDVIHAHVVGTIRTATATHAMTCFVHHRLPLLCLRVENAPADSEFTIKPLAEINDGLAKLNHPPPQRRSEGDLRILIQSIPEGPHYAIAWNARGTDTFLALELGETAEQAETKARSVWQEASRAGFEQLHREHEQEWETFWRTPAVYLPEERMEFFWHYGLYLLKSSARAGSYPPALQGVWSMDGVMPPWRGEYATDMNVQETFWPAASTGHLDLLDVWCDYMRDCIARSQEFTRRFFGTEGIFWPAGTVADFTRIYGWYTCQFAWSNAGWLARLAWLRWRYSLDVGWLGTTGYPIVAEAFRFYQANLEADADGLLHVPLSNSPEYRDNRGDAWSRDPNIDLAVIRRCCGWVEEMESALGREELSASARNIRQELAPYALTPQKVLCLWPGQPLDESHRHPSHLMAIHPMMDLTIDGDEETQAIIAASVQHYQALGQWQWAGHTYAQLISMAAVLGRAGWAYDCLHQFVDHWTRPNGLHCNKDMANSGMNVYAAGEDSRNAPFTMEANNAVTAGINDMLLQGWNDTIRIFPAVPDHWRNVAFRDLLSEGAFRISAVRLDGKTVWVRIQAGVTRVLRLKNPFGDQSADSTGPAPRREGDYWIAELKAGESLTLAVGDTAMDWDTVVRTVHETPVSRLGMQ